MAYQSLFVASIKLSACIIHAASLSGLARSMVKWILKFLLIRYLVIGWPQYSVPNPYRNLMHSQFLFLLIIVVTLASIGAYMIKNVFQYVLW
jgi:hypothetical protein